MKYQEAVKCAYNDGDIEECESQRLYYIGMTYLGHAYAVRDAYGVGKDAFGILRAGEWHENSAAYDRSKY